MNKLIKKQFGAGFILKNRPKFNVLTLSTMTTQYNESYIINVIRNSTALYTHTLLKNEDIYV